MYPLYYFLIHLVLTHEISFLLCSYLILNHFKRFMYYAKEILQRPI